MEEYSFGGSHCTVIDSIELSTGHRSGRAESTVPERLGLCIEVTGIQSPDTPLIRRPVFKLLKEGVLDAGVVFPLLRSSPSTATASHDQKILFEIQIHGQEGKTLGPVVGEIPECVLRIRSDEFPFAIIGGAIDSASCGGVEAGPLSAGNADDVIDIIRSGIVDVGKTPVPDVPALARIIAPTDPVGIRGNEHDFRIVRMEGRAVDTPGSAGSMRSEGGGQNQGRQE